MTLADTMVAGYQIVDLLQLLVERAVEVLDAVAAGILLAADDKRLEVVASTDESSRLIELMQLRAGEGPCVTAFVTGVPVAVDRLEDAETRWPEFAVRARQLGYGSVYSVPLRLRDETIGSLDLFRERTGALTPEDTVAARALADVATIGILQERAFRESDITRQQLQRALDSRVVIEQAKGFVSHTRDIDMDEAFKLIREYARRTGLPIQHVAGSVISGALEL